MESKLIACPVCQSEVSSGAMKCPGCGEALSEKQKHIEEATFVLAKSFNDFPLAVIKGLLWIVALAFWISTAVYIPKTLAVLTVLACIGHISEAKKNKAIRSVKWARVVVSLVLAVTFFVADFYQ